MCLHVWASACAQAFISFLYSTNTSGILSELNIRGVSSTSLCSNVIMCFTLHTGSILSVLHIIADIAWIHSNVKWALCYTTFLCAVSNGCRLNCHLESSLLYKSLNHFLSTLHHFVGFCFETGSHYVALAGLELTVLQSSVWHVSAHFTGMCHHGWLFLCSKSGSFWTAMAQGLRALVFIAENLS